FTSGWPTAPRKIALNFLSSATPPAGKVSPDLRYRSPPQSNSFVSYENFSSLLTAASTLRASAVTSGPVPSPGMTAIFSEDVAAKSVLPDGVLEQASDSS